MFDKKNSAEFKWQPLNGSRLRSLLTFSLLIREDFWPFPDFPSDRSDFSTFVGGYKITAIAEKRQENPEILTN